MLITAKADRENELVRTLIQVSSAALLVLPAIIATKGIEVPRFGDARLFYLGLTALALSLLLAITEQHTSSVAYDKQIDVVFDYYTMKSDRVEDSFSAVVRRVRTAALGLFAAGIVMSGIGLATLI